MMKIALTWSSIALLVIFSQSAQAFLNIESLRQSPKTGFYGTGELKFSGQSGNTDKFTGALSSLNAFKSAQDEYLFLLNYAYGETFENRDTNNGALHLRYTKLLNASLAVEAFVQAQFNEFRQLRLRELIGTGLRQTLHKEERNSVHIGAGVFYEREDIDGFPDAEAVRGNLYLSALHKLGDNTEGSLIAYYQPDIVDVSDYRLHLDTGLKIKLGSLLALLVEFNLQHDSEPPPGVELTDTSYLVGFAVNY